MEGVIVVVPRRLSPDHGEALLREHARWVLAHIERIEARRTRHDQPEGTILWQGCPMRIRIGADTEQRAGRVAPGDGELVLHLPSHGRCDPRRVLETWFADQARRFIMERVRWHAPRMGVNPQRIAIRGQRARWGSCSRAGRLSFNWRLAMAPPEILDYVVVHELAHLLEPNHGRGFWAAVHAHCPDTPRHRKWLRDHGDTLHRPLPFRSPITVEEGIDTDPDGDPDPERISIPHSFGFAFPLPSASRFAARP